MRNVQLVGMVLMLAACRRKEETLAPTYCEGGIIRDHCGGGDGLNFTAGNPDGDPATIGTAVYSTRYMTKYIVRRNGKHEYLLLDKMITSGSIHQDDSWITVKFVDDPNVHKLRSDAPGFLE